MMRRDMIGKAMIRILPYTEPFPTQRLAAVLGAGLWLSICALEVARAANNPSKLQVALAVACVLLPITLLRVSRLPMYLVALYAVLVPFNSLFVSEGGAATLTKMLGILAGGALVFSMILKMQVVPPSRAMQLLLALTIYAGLTVCWAIDPQLALRSYFIYLSYIGLYVVIAFYPATESEVRLVVSATIAGALACAAYGGFLFWQGQHVYETRVSIGDASASSWIDPNEYAAALLTPIAIVLMTAFGTRGLFKKTGWIAALLVLVYGFIASGSRGGMFALGAMLIFLILRSRFRVQLLAIVPALVATIVASPIGHRLLQADLASADLRTDIWKVGLASLHQYWLAGAGIGNFTNAYVQYFLLTPHEQLSWDRVAHSIVIQSAVEYGIPGLILVVSLWYAQFIELARVRADARTRDLCLALQAGVLALFVSGLSLGLMLAKYTWLTFSLVALVRAALLRSQITAREQATSSRRSSGAYRE
jgi:hypothetical protein